MGEAQDKIKAMIVERLFLDIEPSAIGDDASLADSYDVDSVKLFEIVVGLEEIFGVSFEDDEFTVEAFCTVNRIAEAVQKKLGA